MASLWTLFVFLAVSPVQNFHGTIIDPAGAAVAGAQIDISGNGSPVSIVSQSDGTFALDTLSPGRYTVRVTAPGFAANTSTITVPSVPSERLTISMQVASRLDEILVTATRTETPLGMIGVSATVLTSADIGHQQNPAVYELLRDVPGMSVANTSRRGGQTSIYTRGAGKNANLVLMDGIKINDAGGDFNFAHITSTNLERVEVVRGPQSALYGPDASASVVQLVTRRANASDGVLSGLGSFEGGSFDTRRYDAGVSGIVKAFDYTAAAGRLDTESNYRNDAFRNLTLSLNTGVQLDSRSSARFTLRRAGSRVGVPNRVGFGVHDLDAYRQHWFTIGGASYERRGTAYSHRLQLGFAQFRDFFLDRFADGPYTVRGVVAGTAGARGSDAVRLVQLVSPATANTDIVIPPGARLVMRTVRLSPLAQPSRKVTQRRSAEYQGTWNYSSSSSLITGYEWQQERERNDYGRPLRNDHGVFLHNQHSIGSRAFLTESVRLQHNSVYQTKVTPRLSLSYVVTPSLRLKTSWGTGISAPSFLQLFARDSTFFGNPGLRPERSRSAEAGIEQHFWNSRISVEGTWFHNAFRDLIVFTSNTWENIEASRASGTELTARLRTSWLQVRSHYTFLDTRVTAANIPASPSTGVGQELPRRPRHAGAIDVTVVRGRVAVNANTTFVGERQDSDGIGLGVVRNDGYRKMDLGGSYAVHRSLDLFARVDNVLDAEYMEVLGYTALPRNFLAGVRYRWGGQ